MQAISNASRLVAFVGLLCCSEDVLAQGRTLHVDAAYDGAASDGSAAKPYKKLQAAVDAAKDKDTIKVAQGRYADGNIDVRTKTITFLGGYVGGSKSGKTGDFETRDPAKLRSVIVGKRETGDYKKDPAAVFYLGESAGGTIDGFTITGGRHGIFAGWSGSTEALTIKNNVIEDNGIGKPGYEEHGGGIRSQYKNLVIEKNVVRNNKSGRGGGIAVFGEGSARIEKNLIEGNIGLGDHGGGLYFAQNGLIKDNDIRKNEVVGEIIDWMGGVGGGVIVLSGKVRLTENRITDNYAKKCGGGLFVDEAAEVQIDHELIYKNRPPHKEGWGGSGVYVDGASDRPTRVTISYSTIADNAPSGPGVGNGIFLNTLAQVTVKDSIFWSNGPKGDFANLDSKTSTLDISYSVFDGPTEGVRVGQGQSKRDPLFADAANADYQLKSAAGRWDPKAGAWTTDNETSPAVDAADPASPFGNEPAPNGGRANLGRFGDTSFASKSGGQRTETEGSARPVASSGGERSAGEPRGGGCAGCAFAAAGGDGPLRDLDDRSSEALGSVLSALLFAVAGLRRRRY